jgi:2-methylisocitrate lyase-like PEP mutase family enzyme
MSAFKDLHRPGEPLLLPNAWDAVTGAALVQAGFPAIGTTSLGVAAAAGKRDATADAWPETKALTAKLTTLKCHVTVDLEHGFSDDPQQVVEYVTELGGIAGINLEDRHGDPELHARKLQAVKAEHPDLFLNARTDTHWLRDGDLKDAVERAKRYVDAGADGVFVPGLPDQDIAAFVDQVDAPLNVLFTPGTPISTLATRGVARISTGSLLFRAALQHLLDTAQSIRADDALDGLELPAYAAVDALASRSGPAQGASGRPSAGAGHARRE